MPPLPFSAVALGGLSLVLAACGQLFMKAGLIDLDGAAGAWRALLDGFTADGTRAGALWLAAGIACYFAAMVAWLPLLARISLSIAYPLVSVSYVLVYLGAVLWPKIGEQMSLSRSAGIALVVAGVALVAREPSEK